MGHKRTTKSRIRIMWKDEIMSIATRQWIVSHPNTKFQNDSQKNDLLNSSATKTELIAFLQYMIQKKWIIEFTAICSDHHDDTPLCTAGPPYCGTHAKGWAVDCWPLNSPKAGDYIDAGDPRFQAFLSTAMHAPFYMQTGLGGSANSPINQIAAGADWFPDSEADHVHFGTFQ